MKNFILLIIGLSLIFSCSERIKENSNTENVNQKTEGKIEKNTAQNDENQNKPVILKRKGEKKYNFFDLQIVSVTENHKDLIEKLKKSNLTVFYKMHPNSIFMTGGVISSENEEIIELPQEPAFTGGAGMKYYGFWEETPKENYYVKLPENIKLQAEEKRGYGKEFITVYLLNNVYRSIQSPDDSPDKPISNFELTSGLDLVITYKIQPEYLDEE